MDVELLLKKEIDTTLQNLISPNTPLHEAALYSLQAPCKRIRPLLVLATAKMFNIPFEQAMHPACALELIHTYSLIHDDLPCMDDDDYRRGQKTLHKYYDEATAVLTGDYLLTLAFEILAKAPHLSDTTRIKLIQILAKRSGIHGMIGGQMLDIKQNLDIKKLHTLKTAALFQAAFEFGEALASIHEPKLSLFGLNFGLLFQAVDDLIDNDHPEGPQKAREAADAALESCTQILHSLAYDSTPLQPYLEQLSFMAHETHYV